MKDKTTLPALGGGFQMQVTSFDQGWRLADMISQSSLCPKAYAGKPGDCMTAMMMGAELGLNPIQSLQNIATINGKPALYGDACLALVMAHPQFQDIEETYDDQAQRATCRLVRKGRSEVVRTFSKANAEKAGLWSKAGPWKDYPERMLQMRARSRAIRDLFPDALSGLSIAEEAMDIIETVPDSIATAAISHVLDSVDIPQPETEKAPENANAEAVGAPVENGHIVTYAEIRDKIEKSTDPNQLVEIVADVSGMHYLGKGQIKELKDAASARHKAIS